MPLEGESPPARPLRPPLLSLPPYLLSPRYRHPLSRVLSLTLFLSLPVCMVKYCIIVLTAGRKTAQPVVPARRVARIRAACTLLSRPRPAACLVERYCGIASRRVASRAKRVIFVGLVAIVVVGKRAPKPSHSPLIHSLRITIIAKAFPRSQTQRPMIRSAFRDTFRVLFPSSLRFTSPPSPVSRRPPLYRRE